MLPVNTGGHTAYQNTFVTEFLKLYPDPFSVPKSIWDIIVKFWYLDLSETDSILAPFYSSTGKPASALFTISLKDCGDPITIVLSIRSISQKRK